jgi:hypothetical protein
MSRMHRIAFGFLSASACLVGALRAEALPALFSFDLDRFELASELGTVVDEFDDGVVGAPWSVTFGTVTEAGGFATHASPGSFSSVTDGGAFEVVLDRSDSSRPVDWSALGDFTVTTVWGQEIPEPGTAFAHFTDRTIDADTVVHTAIALAFLEPGAAASLGVAPGLQLLVYQQLQTGGFTDSFVSQSLPLVPGQVTGPIWLRTVRDGSGTYRHVASLDGGTTFLDPFSDLPEIGGGGSFVALGFRIVPEPGTLGCVMIGLAGMGVAGGRRRA